MLKARLLLVLLMIGCMFVGHAIWQKIAADSMTFAIIFLCLDAIFYSAAGILLAITFFCLDEHGRIPAGSLAWRYFSGFYKVTEEVDGQTITKIVMPEKIRICPSYWMIFGGIFLVVLMFGVVGGLGWIMVDMVSKGFFGSPAEHLQVKGFFWSFVIMVIAGAGIVGLSNVACFFLRRGKKILAALWIALGCVFAFSVVVIFVAITHYGYGQWPRGAAFIRAAIDVAKGLGIILAVGGAAAACIMGIIWAASAVFPWLKNSLVGRFVVALYYRFCPEIPIEPAGEVMPEK